MPNLFEKASIITTPTAYENGKLLSVKPAKTFGSELVTNGDGSSTIGWDLAYSRTTLSINNNKLRATATEAGAYGLSQDLSLNTSKKYIITANINVDNASGGTANLRIATNVHLSTGATTLSTATGTTTTTFTPTASTMYIGIVDTADSSSNYVEIISISVKELTEADFDFTRGSSATRVNEQGLIQDVQILSGELVQNGNFEQIGSELVTNGNFGTDSDWDLTRAVIENGVGKFTESVGTYSRIRQDINFTGQAKVTYTISFNNSSNTTIQLRDYIGANGEIVSATVGTHTVYRNFATDGVNFQTGGLASDEEIHIDNVSVKEVGQNWEFGIGWSMGDGKAVSDGSANDALRYETTFNPSILKIKFDVNDLTQGRVRLFVNTPTFTELINATSNGSYETTVEVTSGANNLYFFSTNNFIGSIDNISVIEITDDTDLPRINYTNFDYKDVLGDELVTNGSFDTDSDWNLTNASISGGKVNVNSSSPVYIVQNNVATIGKLYKVKFTVSNYVEGDLRLRYPFIISEAEFTGNGTYVFYGTAEDARFELQGRFSGQTYNYSIDNVSVKEFTEDVLVPYSGEGSLLLEPQSTNLVTYSEDFSQGYWNKSGLTLSSNDLVSPDGGLNASKLTNGSSNPSLQTSLSLSVGTTYTISVFVKKETQKWVRLAYVSSTANGAWFDLDENIVGTVNSISATIENYGNGWYRITNTLSSPLASGAVLVGFSGSDGSTSGAAIGDACNIWGMQVEQNSYATSYIPTEGSTKTRLADVCNNSGSSDLINSTEGVLYAEIAALGNQGTAREITINDGTTNNRVIISYNAYNQIRINYRNSSSNIFDQSINSTITDFHKIAVKWKVNDFSFYLDGNEIASSSSGSVIPANTLTTLSFDDGDSSYNFQGNVKCVAVFNEALSDTELACLTS